MQYLEFAIIMFINNKLEGGYPAPESDVVMPYILSLAKNYNNFCHGDIIRFDLVEHLTVDHDDNCNYDFVESVDFIIFIGRKKGMVLPFNLDNIKLDDLYQNINNISAPKEDI
ncbi:hypothetical protein [Persicobacter psychrovividus]|uniref:Uncharacterized protein n=1 Tax=Persicobacter psychrovividus TaxID=387638 RepID=A0ABM7VIC5_9BACT|nr:hypothetical protein PEPS_30020 [Persicobacter psychrovividus]